MEHEECAETLRVLDLRTDACSVSAAFSTFTLRLHLLGDQWILTTSPTDSPIEMAIELPGHWYGDSFVNCIELSLVIL